MADADRFVPVSNDQTKDADFNYFRKKMYEIIYATGNYFITDQDGTPDVLLDWPESAGTWEKLPAGYGLVQAGTATAEDGTKLTFEVGKAFSGGEFKHQLTTNELAHFEGSFACVGPRYHGRYTSGIFSAITVSANDSNCREGNQTTGNIYGFKLSCGKDLRHNNVPPCRATNVWVRT